MKTPYPKIFRTVITAALLGAGLWLALASVPSAGANDDNRAPELPSPLCDSLQAPPGHKVAFHTYALGVQKYRWNGASWDFVAPEANLYADASFRGKVGTHYGGPTWESNNGSYVIGKLPRRAACDPEPASSIPWLLLDAASTQGQGIFSGVTHIQRVNTTGGLIPTTPGSFVGAEKRVPYTAEYYFYRAEN